MFEDSRPQEAAPPLATVPAKAVSSAPSQDTAAIPPKKQPSVVIPSIVSAASTAAEQGTSTSPVAQLFSVDSWEQQREKEMERLRQRKQEEENRRLAALLEEEHRTLGAKWVEVRTVSMNSATPVTEEEKLNHAITTAGSVEDALSCLEKLISVGARASGVLPSAVWTVAEGVLRVRSCEQFACQDRFLELLEKAPVPAELKGKVRLRFARGEDLVSQYRSMSEDSRKNLSLRQVRQLVGNLTLCGFWEEAIQLSETSRSYLTDRNGTVCLALARAARTMEEETSKAQIAAYVTKSLTAAGRLGREAKLALALLEKGSAKVGVLTQLAASHDADERVYAELLKRTPQGKVHSLLDELERRGLDRNDPYILEALVYSKLRSDDPFEVFVEIERQVTQGGLRGSHLSAALAAAKLTPSTEVLAAALKLAMRLPDSRPVRTLQTLLPLLYASGMLSEIVELVDLYGKHVPVVRALPKHAAFANEALTKAGREPLSTMTIRESGLAVPVVRGSGGLGEAATLTGSGRFSSKVAREEGSTVRVSALGGARTVGASSSAAGTVYTGDLAATTETLLSYAKERQWLKALSVLDTLAHVPTHDLSGNSTAAALTLAYNCALSASVENPEVVLSVFSLMKERGVVVNATTVNTVLSSLSKSPQWEESIPLFESTTKQQRDMNTYLVMVSLLGKHSKGELAVKVYDEMKKSNPKPPATMFSVAIGATANHSWTDTLRIFQEMLKLHGASVKDSVVNQVIRCLEQNGKMAEVAKLEREIQKKRRKK